MKNYSRLLKFCFLLCLCAGAFHPSLSQAAPKLESLDKLFQESKRLFYKDDYDGSLDVLKKYFSRLIGVPKEKARTQLRFSAIVAMGRIYLQEKQDPAGAIQWFEKIEKSQTLTPAEHDIIEGWIAGARDWIKAGKFPKEVKGEQELFELGSKYYQSGLKKQKFPMDPAGVADFSIASSYLMPFLVNFDKSPSVGDALYMMGDMRRRFWTDTEYWSKNFYLTEAIRRFAGTPLAVKAYTVLDEDVHYGYSGSGGDHVPQSWTVLLGELKKIAEGKPTAAPEAQVPEKKAIQ